MRVALLNLRYSPNLGDVLLCECLEYGMRQAAPDLYVIQIDMTGRRQFAKANPRRLAAMAVLQRLPLLARQSIARFVLGRSLRRVLPYWTSVFVTTDAAVLGGGNLLADSDLNFPLKVSAVLSAIAIMRKPVAVYAVGASDNWSRAGEKLFRTALANVRLVHAAVRDAHSQAIWNRRLGPIGLAEPMIVRDPGLLAAECYPARPRIYSAERRVGLCMTHPVALSYHADETIPSEPRITAWMLSLAQALAQKGYAVSLFTTGSPEDEAYLDSIMPGFETAAGSTGTISRTAHFESAADMVAFVAPLDLLFGHRLHACIAAYAFSVPNIGFTWDAKMRSFFGSVGRADFIVPAVSTSVEDVLELAHRALTDGIDEDARALVVSETHRDIATLVQTLAVA